MNSVETRLDRLEHQEQKRTRTGCLLAGLLVGLCYGAIAGQQLENRRRDKARDNSRELTRHLDIERRIARLEGIELAEDPKGAAPEGWLEHLRTELRQDKGIVADFSISPLTKARATPWLVDVETVADVSCVAGDGGKKR